MIKLNLGCGTDIRPGFVNIDIQKFKGVDEVADAIELPQYGDESVDFVVAQHFLEYIPRNDMTIALAEWKRVLKKECALEIRVTDINLLTKAMYLNSVSKEMGLHHEMVLALLYGRQVDGYDVRYNGFTSEYLQGILVSMGFSIVNIAHEDFDVIITGIKK